MNTKGYALIINSFMKNKLLANVIVDFSHDLNTCIPLFYMSLFKLKFALAGKKSAQMLTLEEQHREEVQKSQLEVKPHKRL